MKYLVIPLTKQRDMEKKDSRKSLRFRDELTKEILQLAFKEKRSFNNMVEVLTEEALLNRKSNKGGKK